MFICMYQFLFQFFFQSLSNHNFLYAYWSLVFIKNVPPVLHSSLLLQCYSCLGLRHFVLWLYFGIFKHVVSVCVMRDWVDMGKSSCQSNMFQNLNQLRRRPTVEIRQQDWISWGFFIFMNLNIPECEKK
jgi:hypothetical protein